jgi:hypothetical protein
MSAGRKAPPETIQTVADSPPINIPESKSPRGISNLQKSWIEA